MRLSVVICCANAADTLEHACLSVAWADELVIVDSGSSDATPEIARRHADRYLVEPWRGYSKQKQFGAEQATHDWVLVLDGDETCSDLLAREWRELDDTTLAEKDVLLVPRRNYIFGRHARAWDPDWQSRLIHRHRAHWADEALHDARLPSAPGRLGRLRGWIEHKRYSHAGFEDYFSGRRLDARLMLLAREMHQRGKRCRPWDPLLRPLGAFLKFYLIKRGFMDGTFGLLIAQKTAVTTQLKYAALWALQQTPDTSVDDASAGASAGERSTTDAS